MENQNWDYKVISKKEKVNGQQGVNQAIANGQEVESYKKAGSNNKNTLDGKHVATILASEEEYKVETVSHDFKIALQQARMAKKLTQTQLAQQVNEKETVIKEYESGKAIPNNQVIQKLERALGVQLPKQKKKKKNSNQDKD